MPKVQHFDAPALLQQVAAQPLGLCVSTNHPAGFRRLLYAQMRKPGQPKVKVLQSPHSPTAFYLISPQYQQEPSNVQ